MNSLSSLFPSDPFPTTLILCDTEEQLLNLIFEARIKLRNLREEKARKAEKKSQQKKKRAGRCPRTNHSRCLHARTTYFDGYLDTIPTPPTQDPSTGLTIDNPIIIPADVDNSEGFILDTDSPVPSPVSSPSPAPHHNH
jgi:hypothetical protein